MAVTINASTSAGLVNTADTSGVLALQTAGTTAVSISASQVVTLTNALAEASGGTGTTVGYNGFKNRIINGALGIWQRGTSFSGTVYAADRWQCAFGTGVTISQSSDVPSSAFQYSISLAGSNFPTLAQRIESRNSFDLVGQSVTISFWLKQTSGAGSNSIGLQLYFPTASDNFASQTQIGSSVNISATSSWVQYTTTFTSLPSGVANGLGLQIYSNAAGSATYLVTGVQLEKGSTATSFDYRPYGTELVLCQRYYEKSYDIGTVPATATANGATFSTMLQGNTTTSSIGSFIVFKQTKRSTPTMSLWDNSGNSGKATRDNFGVSEQTNVTAATQNTGESSTQVYVNAGNAASGLKVQWTASAEL